MAKFDKIGITKYKLIPPGLEIQQRTVTMYKRNRKLLTGVEDENTIAPIKDKGVTS